MNRLIFNREEYYRVYNCSMKTSDEWYMYGTKNLSLGIFYIVSGIVYETFYIPVLTVMLRDEFFKYSSYKIMFVMGVIDAITLIEICFFNGYDSIMGEVFCTNPTRSYLVALVSTFGWYTGSLMATLLAMDRCLEILVPNFAKMLFSGNRMMIWISFCIFYGFINLWFQYPFLYNSHYGTVFYNPHFGDEFFKPFEDPLYFAHNISMVCGIVMFYIILCIGWACKFKEFSASAYNLSQRLINIQAFMISMEIVGTGMMCIYFQFHAVPDFLYIVSHVLWQMSHGDDGVLIFIINKSIRNAVLKKVKKIFYRENTSSVHIVHQGQLGPQNYAYKPNQDSISTEWAGLRAIVSLVKPMTVRSNSMKATRPSVQLPPMRRPSTLL